MPSGITKSSILEGIIFIIQITKRAVPELVSGGPKCWYFSTKGSVIHTASIVKSSEKICIPWAFRLFAGVVPLACSGLLSVDQVVGVVSQHFADNEVAFPRCRQLVLAGCSLD